MPVEAVVAVETAVGTMEITVSKVELLRELTATQGVVERKTTIPILSNYLFEAADGKLSLTATDLDLSLRTSCNAKVKKEGSCTIPARKLHDYVKLAAGRRYHDQAAGESLGQHSLRAVQHEDGGDGEVEFPQPAGVSYGWGSKDSGAGLARVDCADWFCNFQ